MSERPAGDGTPERASRWDALLRNPVCVFCDIVTGIEPADIVYQDEDVIVFRNLLQAAPVMLIAAPTRHRTQKELWAEIGHLAAVAAEIGGRLCPRGFRLVSNFGPDGHQSQEHAHLHILGGTHLGFYIYGPIPMFYR